MSEIYLIAASALHFIVIACFVTTHRNLNVLLFKVYPIVLAFGLSAIATAKFMGWPL